MLAVDKSAEIAERFSVNLEKHLKQRLRKYATDPVTATHLNFISSQLAFYSRGLAHHLAAVADVIEGPKGIKVAEDLAKENWPAECLDEIFTIGGGAYGEHDEHEFLGI